MSDNVQAYYDQASEKEWDRLETVSQVEFFVTRKLLQELIGKRTLKILDLGGGPGRYSIELTKQGHEVTLVYISKENLSLAREKATQKSVEIANVIHASAVDLSMLPDKHFDLALSMGPMYHLTSESDLALASAELLRVMKPGARAVVAFITKFAVLRDVLLHAPERLIDYSEHYRDVMSNGVIIQPPESGFTDLRLFDSKEIAPLMTSAGFLLERLVGCEGPMNLLLYDAVNVMPENKKDQIFNFILQYSEWPSLLDSSDHILFIGRRPIDGVTLLSESALEDWNRPEEDKAWEYLQHDRT